VSQKNEHSSYDESVALFVIGGSPAIVTETLAAYANEDINTVPEKIAITTTTMGKKRLLKTLIDAGGWSKFIAAYPVYRNMPFSEESISVAGNLSDISNDEDSRVMMEAIFRMVIDAVDGGKTRVLASIAGGRKTMTYYLGFAMSLFGQPWDRITHVIVPPEWERDRDFLFPPVDKVDQILLIDTPFIRLHSHIKGSFAHANIDALLQSAQTSLDLAAQHPLMLDISQQTIHYLDQSVTLSPREFSIYQFFAQQKTEHCSKSNRALCDTCRECFLSYDEAEEKKEDLFKIRMQFGGRFNAHYEKFEDTWSKDYAFRDLLSEPVKKIENAISKVFGADPRAESIMIKNIGRRNNSAFGLMAEKKQIKIKLR